MRFEGGRLLELVFDAEAATVAVRVEGGAFNAGDGDDGWGRGDFTLLFSGVSGFEGVFVGGAIQSFVEGPPAGEQRRVRLVAEAGEAAWACRNTQVTWFVPTRAIAEQSPLGDV